MSGTDRILAKHPSEVWVSSFFSKSLRKTRAYQLEMVPDVPVKLDQNENPWDWDIGLKQKVLAQLAGMPWNRYPDPFGVELKARLAESVGLSSACLCLGPGSNHLISLVVDAIGHTLSGDVIIARPSFALFEEQCQYSDVNFKVWPLNDQLEFDVGLLPSLRPGSLVVFASPNNPTGSHMPLSTFESLLSENPEVLFFADQAYAEFCDDNYLELLSNYSNFLCLRTFSKAMGSAGVRLGYLAGPERLISEISKRRLPYLLNHFALAAGMVLLSDAEAQAQIRNRISLVVQERQRVWEALSVRSQASYQVYSSYTNFLLIRWKKSEECLAVHRKLVAAGVLVRNVSRGPGLEGCLRVSIGTAKENDAFLAAIL